MTESPTSGNPPAAPGTELELLASLQIFGLPVEATATFGPSIDTILAARFGDATLGDVLTYLVSKAEPGLDFKLTPPWDLLNTINLHDFVFEVDLTNFRVGFRYDNLDFSFPLVSLDRIEVWYSPATKTKNKSVDLSLFGSFLGVDFSSEPGLTWDVLSQPPPAVPGQGPKVFDLEYLGLGQHVTLRDPASLATLALVIDALEGSYANVDPHSNPLATLTALKFDASSGWLFGAKFSALETVTLSAVFNDPVLYGLRLALDGQRAGTLAGLEFEILYRKVSDSLGVFHIELKLPDAMRKIEAGEANITLPIIDLDIYTNGDFLVDLGFPYNLDFSRAFQIDMIVWVGPIPIPVSAAAGLYFGVLSGQTATQVPQVSNGSFAPVIVAGFGVRVGLGYAVSIGPLDAGFFAGFLGILEGVLAWFHPDSDPGARSVYFKVTGTVGIQIHIWGTVDFVILQASLDVYAYATATVVIESYQPIQVGFEAGISVSVSIRVLFFSITLSFSATISESFTIGQAAPTPWVIGAAPSAPSQSAVAPQFATRGIVRSSGGVVQASPVFAHVLATGISWHDQPAPAAQSGLTLGVYLQPMITAGLPGDYPGGNLGSQPQPQLVATLLVADRGQLEGALAVANADLPLTAGLTLTGPDGTTLTKPDGTPVTTQPGDTFGKLAGTSPAAPDVFTLGSLTRTVPGLLPKGTAIALPDETVTLDGGGYTVPTDTETLSSIAAQLLSPFEQLTREALLWAVESAQLSVQQAQAALGGPATAPVTPAPATPGPATPGPDTPVSASHLHALYVDLTNPDTPFPLSQVVNFLTSRGITVDLRPMPTTGTGPDNPSFTMFPMLPFLQLTADGTTVDFGTGPYQATPAYQQYLTRYFQELAAPGAAPGGTAPPTAVSDGQPESLAALLFTDCFVFILRQLVQDALDLYRAYPYQAQSTDILADIANRFGITDPDLVELNRDAPGLLAAGQTITFATGDTVTTQPGDTFGDLLDRSRHSTTELAAAIGVQSALLQPGAVLTLIGGGTYAVADGDTLLAIATTRQSAVTDTVAVARIAEANKTSQTFFASGAQLAINQQSTRVVGGDTLRTLAARLQLTPLLVALAIRRDTGVLTVGSTIQVSGGSYVVGHGDTLASIAAGLTAPLDVVAGAAAAVPGLLIPLTTLTLTGRSYVVGPFDTLASIAAATGAALTDVATAVADQLFAGVGFPLPTLPYTVAASSSDPATSESLDAIAGRFGTTLAAVVGGANADALALRTGAPVTFGLTTQIRPDDSLTILAKRFHVDIADVAVALSDQVGLLTSGATIVVNSAAQDPQASYVIKRGDTLASIAAAFGTSAEAIIAANPQVSCQPGKPCWSPIPGASLPRPGMGISMPVGLRINLPSGSAYQAGGQDTLAGIAERFSLSVADLVPAVADATLTPQATVVLPPISYQVADGDTPLSIAAWFGLTVQQLVLANTDVGFDTVVVPDAEVVPLGTLVGDLAQGGSFDKPSGSLARFLLHGLRLPSPTDAVAADPADQRLYPLYTLTGQQFTPPTPPPDNYALTLAANAIAPQHLLTFAGATGPLTVPLSSGDRTALANIAGQLATNPPIDLGVLAATRYPPYVVVPRQYALGKPVPWQAATQPPLRYDPAGTGAAASQPPGGQPTLLPFPDALRHQIAASADAAGPGLWVGLASGSKANPAAPTQITPIDGFGWATKIGFGLRRAPDPNAPDQPLPNIYQVFGVDQDAIADLQQLLDYALGTSDTLTLALAYPLSTTAALRSDPVDPAGVLLVKANLSTQPRPPVATSAELLALATPLDAAPVTVAATMSSADARDFLTLLWEATVTNTGGYYLYYQVGQDGPGLPAEIFNQDPTATVSLLITAFPAVGSGSSTIPLRAFHNTALVTDNLADPNAAVFAVPQQLPLSTDPATLPGLGISVSSLVAANVTTANLLKPGQQITAGGASYTVQPGDDIVAVALALGQQVGVVVQQISADQDYLTDYFNPEAKVEIYPEWLTAQGTLRPGAAGFRLVRTDPDPADPETPRPAVGTPQDPVPQDPKTQLEVLFNLVGYQLLANGGFRASADGRPAGPARSTSGPLNYELTAVGGVEPQIYEKQLRIDRFATTQPAAALDGQQDPYAGVGTQARFGWQPQDVFGNRLLAPQGIDVDVGYTDDLVALSQWPSVVTGYQFAGPAGAATVQVSIALDTSAYVATPGEVFVPVVAPGAASLPTGVAAQATAHRDRYAEIFWQLSHDVTAEVTTTVDGTVDGPASHPVDVAGLAAFASGAWGYLATVAATTQLTATTAAGDTLASIAATYQVSPAELAEVNRSAAQSFAATELLTPSATVTVDQRYTVIQGDTLAGIAQRSPASASPADLAAGNPALALQPGITLASGYQARAGDTLASVAAASGVTAADIGTANAQVAGLLAPEQPVLLGHVSYLVQPGDTFSSIAAVTGATVADLATANATAAGLLAAGQAIAIPRHVVLAAGTGTHQVAAGDTLASIAGPALEVTALGSANSDVTGLLATGVQLSFTTPDGHGSTTTQPNDTLSTVALRLQGSFATQQVTVALLAEQNQNVPCLARGATLLVPPADVTLGVPVTASNPAVVFALETAVTLTRTAHVDPALAAAGASDVSSVTTPLAPALPEGAAGQTLALQSFAVTFEEAFTTPQLKLATTGSGSSGTRTQQLFAVQYDTPALNYTILGGTPYFFAPPPLSTALWSSPGPIPIRSYTRGQPLGPAQPTSFTGVDLDGWAQTFLAQLDLVLSSDYAVAAYSIDPARYTALIQAKKDLASAIQDSVDIVVQPGPDPQGPGPDLAAAKDALYQRLLVTLSTAYQVDTIVQLPVTVTAPADWTGDTAPRLLGQPAAAPFIVGTDAEDTLSTDTLSTVATHFQAPLELLVTALANDGYLLAAGFNVPIQAGYTVAPGDTLASVATHFTMSVAALGDALADQTGLLQPGAAVNLVRRTYPLAADDTLFSAISYLALDVATSDALASAVDNFAAMNATLPNLFAAGTTLQMPPPPAAAAGATVPPYQVQPGDTLTTIAAAVGQGATPSWIVTTQLHTAQVLQAGTSVAYLSRVAGFSLSDANISLVNGQHNSLTFLFHTASSTALSNLTVQLSYQVNQLEYGIEDVSWASGYQSSQWLTFLRPPTDAAIGMVDVPIPLRAYPVPPSVTGQQIVPFIAAFIAGQDAGPPTLQQLRRYNYDYTFSTQRAAQDTVSTSQLQNTVLADGTTASAPQNGLPAALAQYTAIRDGLEQDLALLTRVNPRQPVTVRTADTDTLTTLAQAAIVDVGYFGGVNAEAAGLLQSGTQLAVGGLPPYTVAAADTLGGIADRLHVDPDQVVAAAAGAPLTAGVELIQPRPDNEPAWQALRVFTALAGQVAGGWQSWVAAEAGASAAPGPPPSAAVGAVPQYAPRYQVRLGTLATGETTVHLLPDGDAAAVHADDLVVGLSGYVPVDGSGQAARQQVVFTPRAVPAGTPAQTSPEADEFNLLVPDRDVVTTQNIWGEVSITRNANLLAGLQTNPAFVYMMPEVKAATPGVPLTSWTDPLDLAGVPFDPPAAESDGTRPLVDWLINFFDALLNRYAVLDTDTLTKIAMRYDLTLAGLAPAVASVPGLLIVGAQLPLPNGSSHQVASGDTLTSVAAANSAQVADLVQTAADVTPLLAPGVLIRPAAVSRNLRVAVDYSFPLATAGAAATGQATQSEIVSRLPVLLCPTFLFSSATDLQPGAGFCASLAQQLAAWAAARGLPPGVGRWVLDVSLYTTLPGAAQAPPLLELTDVRLDRRLVAPDPGGSP